MHTTTTDRVLAVLAGVAAALLPVAVAHGWLTDSDAQAAGAAVAAVVAGWHGKATVTQVKANRAASGQSGPAVRYVTSESARQWLQEQAARNTEQAVPYWPATPTPVADPSPWPGPVDLTGLDVPAVVELPTVPEDQR